MLSEKWRPFCLGLNVLIRSIALMLLLHHKNSRNTQASRLRFRIVRSFQNLAGFSAVMQQSCTTNFTVKQKSTISIRYVDSMLNFDPMDMEIVVFNFKSFFLIIITKSPSGVLWPRWKNAFHAVGSRYHKTDFIWFCLNQTKFWIYKIYILIISHSLNISVLVFRKKVTYCTRLCDVQISFDTYMYLTAFTNKYLYGTSAVSLNTHFVVLTDKYCSRMCFLNLRFDVPRLSE